MAIWRKYTWDIMMFPKSWATDTRISDEARGWLLRHEAAPQGALIEEPSGAAMIDLAAAGYITQNEHDEWVVVQP